MDARRTHGSRRACESKRGMRACTRVHVMHYVSIVCEVGPSVSPAACDVLVVMPKSTRQHRPRCTAWDVVHCGGTLRTFRPTSTMLCRWLRSCTHASVRCWPLPAQQSASAGRWPRRGCRCARQRMPNQCRRTTHRDGPNGRLCREIRACETGSRQAISEGGAHIDAHQRVR